MSTFHFHEGKAEKIAARQAAKMVTAVSKETERALRTAITEAVRDREHPYEAARTIKSMIGLNVPQRAAVKNYKIELINRGLTLDKVNVAVDKYADKLLNVRARTIARTEILSALNEGHIAAWEQAQDEGHLSPDAMMEWITTDDDRLCAECEAMDGDVMPLGEDFPDGNPPLHPSCRCVLGIAAK